METAISLRELKVGWGAQCVLPDLRLEVRRGEVLCVVGPGAGGKSTLLRALEQLVANSGRGSRSPSGAPPGTGLWWKGRVTVGTGACLRLPQHGSFSSQRVGDLLRGAGLDDSSWLPEHARAAVDALAETPLFEVDDTLRRVISFALVASASAPLLLFDEPTFGLAEPWIGFISTWLHALADQGHAVVFVTHYLPLARSGSDRVALMLEGRLLEVQSTEDFFCHAVHPRTLRYLRSGG